MRPWGFCSGGGGQRGEERSKKGRQGQLPFSLPLTLQISNLLSPGACFTKVPIINGPGKPLPFTLKIEVSMVLHPT